MEEKNDTQEILSFCRDILETNYQGTAREVAMSIIEYYGGENERKSLPEEEVNG